MCDVQRGREGGGGEKNGAEIDRETEEREGGGCTQIMTERELGLETDRLAVVSRAKRLQDSAGFTRFYFHPVGFLFVFVVVFFPSKVNYKLRRRSAAFPNPETMLMGNKSSSVR